MANTNPRMAGSRHVLLKQLDRLVAFRLPTDHLDKFDEICRRHDLTRSRFLRKSIAEFIKKNKANTDPETGNSAG